MGSPTTEAHELDGLSADDMLVIPRERWDRLKRFTVGLVHALYDGVPGQVEPESDADVLRYVADWLDRADDARDSYLDAHGESGGRGRETQTRLRAIADRLAILEPNIEDTQLDLVDGTAYRVKP